MGTVAHNTKGILIHGFTNKKKKTERGQKEKTRRIQKNNKEANTNEGKRKKTNARKY